MKKIFLPILFTVFITTGELHAQDPVAFGVKGGVNLTFFKTSQEEFGVTPQTFTGFYGGGFVDFAFENGFSLQPEFLYIVLNDFNFINAPIYTKYEVINNLNLLVGPSLNYFFDFFSNKFKVRADIATSYNVTPEIGVHMKYTLGFQEVTPNGLFLGLGLKF